MSVTTLPPSADHAVDTVTTPTAPDAAARPPTQYPLGWLRGLAALAVVFFHGYQHNRTGDDWAWPWTGTAHQLMLGTDLFVDMFFVLSGLVLWLPVARACADGAAGRPGRVLLLRRMARLLPLYYAIVLVVWVSTNPSLPGHWQDLLMHLTFTQVYSDQYIFWTDGPAWSLAVEFHFYVLMALAVPFVNRAVRDQGRPPPPDRRRRGAAGAQRAGRVRLPAVGDRAHDPGLRELVGLVLPAVQGRRLRHRHGPRGAGRGRRPALAAGPGSLGVLGVGALLALVLTRPPLAHGLSEWWHPMYAAAVAAALAGVVLHEGPWSKAFDWKPLVWVGTLGYGVYLVHEPVMRLLGHLGVLPDARPGSFFMVTAALVVVPSLALAWLSARTLEPAGIRMLAMMDQQGRPRDYYDHLVEDEMRERV